jgi:hypothetical protein
MNVIVVIADIVQSKRISDREKFQKGLEKELNEINSFSKKNILSPYTITLGDEFQAVYKTAGSIFTDIWKIIDSLYPYKVRFAIGHDQILTKTNEKSALGMDGPAFHSARDGLSKMKNHDMTIIQFFGSEIPAVELINNSLLLVAEIMDKWKQNTVSVMNGIMRNKKYGIIGKELDITERAVYKTVNTNHIKTIIEIQESVARHIEIGVDLF